ncbi:hypothetical protein EYF80_057231 [Liparis tanakae]|uniref:Uncharacterized protein n=1 Tax=Liparis tanakae TaxID=230148 RepID=A0A4Z2EUJ4_9TELE|nr:hypothetical protein EYF80_057231 [Liparis tanakae]
MRLKTRQKLRVVAEGKHVADQPPTNPTPPQDHEGTVTVRPGDVPSACLDLITKAALTAVGPRRLSCCTPDHNKTRQYVMQYGRRQGGIINAPTGLGTFPTRLMGERGNATGMQSKRGGEELGNSHGPQILDGYPRSCVR